MVPTTDLSVMATEDLPINEPTTDIPGVIFQEDYDLEECL